MKYSDNQCYMMYMEHKAAGDFRGALTALECCLTFFPVEIAPVQHADLLQKIARLHFELGEEGAALRYFTLSEKSDPESLLMPYYHAKFLAEQMGLNEQAIKKCEAIIDRAAAHPFAETDMDFGSQDYIKMANKLISLIKQKSG